MRSRGAASTASTLNTFLQRWNRTVTRLSIHGMTRRKVWTHSVYLERPALQPLPTSAFPLFQNCERTVKADGNVEVASAVNPVPLALLGTQVRIQWDAQLVRVLGALWVQTG